MKKIFKMLSIQNLKETFIDTSKRFPVSLILVFLIFGLFIYMNNFWEYLSLREEELVRINLSFIVTFFLSVWFYIFSESEKHSSLKTNIFQIIWAFFWVGFYIFFESNFNYENVVFFIITTFWILSFIFFAPFLRDIFDKNSKSEKKYFNYLAETIKILIISVIIWFLSSFLGSIAINSIFELFDLNSFLENWKWTSNWIIFSCSLFAPLYALSNLTKKEKLKEEEITQNKVSLFFINYIIFPFVITFFVILYAYSVKVLANFWEWPNGQISWMVIFFSIFAYIAYIVSYNSQTKFIISARKVIPFAVIPQVFMLFYSIYVRIANYGLTINRYLVVVFWIILISISLYLIFSKRKYLAMIPFLLTIFSVVISVWPWSIYSLPQKNQLVLLKNDLKKANILKENWEIVYPKSYNEVDKELWKNIYSKINYLCNYNDCKKLKEIFSKEYKALEEKNKKEWEERKNRDIKRYKKAIEKYKDSDKKRTKLNKRLLKKTLNKKYKWPNSWEIKEFISNKIKVKPYYNFEKNMINFYSKDPDYLDISSYDKYLKVPNYEYKNRKNVIDLEKNNINISLQSWNEETISFPFNLRKKLIEEIERLEKDNKYEENENIVLEENENIILEFEVWDKKYKLIVKNASFSKDEESNDNYKYNDDRIGWVLLIWEK